MPIILCLFLPISILSVDFTVEVSEAQKLVDHEPQNEDEIWAIREWEYSPYILIFDWYNRQMCCDKHGNLHLFLGGNHDESSWTTGINHSIWWADTGEWDEWTGGGDDYPEETRTQDYWGGHAGDLSCAYAEVNGEERIYVSHCIYPSGSYCLFELLIGWFDSLSGKWVWPDDPSGYTPIAISNETHGNKYHCSFDVNNNGDAFCSYFATACEFTWPPASHRKSKIMGGAIEGPFDTDADIVRVNDMLHATCGGWCQPVCVDENGVAHIVYYAASELPGIPSDYGDDDGIHYTKYNIHTKKIKRFHDFNHKVFPGSAYHSDLSKDNNSGLHLVIKEYGKKNIIFYNLIGETWCQIKKIDNGLPNVHGFAKLDSYIDESGTLWIAAVAWTNKDENPDIVDDRIHLNLYIFNYDDSGNIHEWGPTEIWGIGEAAVINPSIVIDKTGRIKDSFLIHIAWSLSDKSCIVYRNILVEY